MFYANFFPLPKFFGNLTSLTNHPNYVPPLIVVGILCNLFLLYFRKEDIAILTKIVYVFTILVQILAVLLSFSRTGMIGIAIGALVFLVFVFRKRTLIVLPFIVILFPLFVLNFVKAKGFDSFISRFYLLIPAYFMLISDKIHLLWGYGVTNATKVYVEYKSMYGVFEDVNNPHNSYISYIMMYGLIFTVLFVTFILYNVIVGIKNSIKSRIREEQLLFGLFVSVVVSYMVQGLFESQLAMTDYFMMIPFLIFSGLLYTSNKKQKKLAQTK
jgi:O-antigen ligase